MVLTSLIGSIMCSPLHNPGFSSQHADMSLGSWPKAKHASYLRRSYPKSIQSATGSNYVTSR
ncbi:MAG TPA: hypothetical protein VKK79_22200 [Candidatus Lokiarchaeia archaeon]|nr:hypothetical protein [Candidatus Lokiarchaeia archaeon]